MSEEFNDQIVAEGQDIAKAEKLISEIIVQLGHVTNIAFHLKEIFQSSRQKLQKCVINASRDLNVRISFIIIVRLVARHHIK